MDEEAATVSARVCVVTGATGMLGRATAIELAARGANVVLVCRDPARGAGVREEVGKAGPAGSHRLLVGDLADPEAVLALAAQIGQDSDQLHALVHTAATLTQDRQSNRANHELMFATNVLGRFLLTHQLLPLLERGAPARVLVVTGPSPDRLDFDDLMAAGRDGGHRQRLPPRRVAVEADAPDAGGGSTAHLAPWPPTRPGRPRPWRPGAGGAVRAGDGPLLQARTARHAAEELTGHRRPAATVDRVPAAAGHRITMPPCSSPQPTNNLQPACSATLRSAAPESISA